MWISAKTLDRMLTAARDRGGSERGGEIARLMGLVDTANARADRLTEALIRLARHEAGLAENEPRQRPASSVLTPELLAYTSQFTGSFRNEATAAVEARLAAGEDPHDILDELTGKGER